MTRDYQAMAIQAFGEPGALKPISVAYPTIAEDEVLVKVLSAAINPIDVKTRAGIGFAAEQNKHNLPLVLGYDLYGEVVDCGDKVSGLSNGDLVMGMVGFATHPGTYAQYAKARRNELIKVDKANADPLLAGLCLAGLTAFQAINKLECPKSQPLYINGANGTVGSLALQIAANMGYRVVAITRSPLPDGLAERFEQISYDDFVTAPAKRYLLDVVGMEVGMRCLQGLSAHSVIVTVPTLSQAQIIAAAKVQGVKGMGVLVVKNAAQLQRLYSWYCQGRLTLAHRCMPLSAAGMAHQQIEQNSSKEKVILLPWS
ncbi:MULTISPECIES: alcohol dehydrogenase catalytic domain-containing protein [unclassified Pseudoalteromonas]|uniref:alcohol dehydrogenase catalytic domain-containing protein n=1 Tax=unclassified Pseudoalteromonas TaxID=194690 RepID=UPI000CF69E53|nr:MULTISPECIES: alcohol dehydrogenase catalytic domain-containing protein [unclassified Pseudoalteromonas]MBS3796241.1 alcohol dehydrogenase catalytic domain-containing protein [Pseudoalteromonas sp. BDTF-M6]